MRINIESPNTETSSICLPPPAVCVWDSLCLTFKFGILQQANNSSPVRLYHNPTPTSHQTDALQNNTGTLEGQRKGPNLFMIIIAGKRLSKSRSFCVAT